MCLWRANNVESEVVKSKASKTEVVRIKTGYFQKLRMLSDLTGHSVSWMLDRAIELFLAQEAPVYEEAYRAARAKLESKERHPVHSEGIRT